MTRSSPSETERRVNVGAGFSPPADRLKPAPARRLSAVLAVFILASCASAPPAPTPVPPPPSVQPDGSFAFVGVNLIPMTSEVGVVRNQTVIVRDGRVSIIGDAATTNIDPATTRIEAKGQYLIPGLADMHVHLEYFEGPSMLELFVANGVTFVRNMDGRPSILEWKKDIAAGGLSGPSILTAGPILDGAPPTIPDNTVVKNADEAKAAVADQHAAGYDFIKVYSNLTTEAFNAIVEESRVRGLPVVGHVPRRLSVTSAAKEMKSVEHLTDFDDLIEADDSPYLGRFHWSKLYLAMAADPSKIRSAADAISKSGAAVVPTLIQVENALAPSDALTRWMERDSLRYVPTSALEFWRNRVRSFSERLGDDDWQTVERGRNNRFDLVKALAGAGVTVLAGTDTPNPFVVPGFSLHEELQLLVRAGLTPKIALASATREAAAFVGQSDDWGTIEPGKRADLVLLDRNPLSDITATSKPAGVMIRGRWLTRADLEVMLQRQLRR